jgi:phosphofructokinase-like protein
MRIAISTGGGDCPGLNAVIRAVVRTAIVEKGWQVSGILDGLTGLHTTTRIHQLDPTSVRDILDRGGTILGSTNRGNPLRHPVEIDGRIEERDVTGDLIERARALDIEAIVFVGGDGTQAIAQAFHDKGFPVVGVPKTIDNDLDATDVTFGFDTAVGIAMEALDRLRTTAASHDRVMILELMGRHAGWITLHAGIAGDADVILLPEIPYNIDAVVRHLQRRKRSGITHSVVCIAEGARPSNGELAWLKPAEPGANARLGGAGEVLAGLLAERMNVESRVTVLGHIQRGGSPSAVDRILGTRFGVHAVDLIAQGRFGEMVCLRGTEVDSVPICDAIGRMKEVPVDGSLIRAARAVGTCMGDEVD